MALTKINLGNMVTGTLPDANIPNDITIDVSSAVPASGLTGNTLASGVTASSLQSVGTLGSLAVTGNITTDGIFKVDSAPDSDVIQFDQGGRKSALKTYFASNSTDSRVIVKVSDGNTNGGMVDALDVRPAQSTFAGDVKISSSSDCQLQLARGSEDWYLKAENAQLSIKHEGNNALYFDTSLNATFGGKVITSASTDSVAEFSTSHSTGAYLSTQNSGTSFGYFGSAKALVSGSNANNDLAVRAENTLFLVAGGSGEDVKIEGSGNTTFASRVTMSGSGSDKGFFLGGGWQIFDNASVSWGAGDSLVFYHGGTRLYLGDTGGVGIGTTSVHGNAPLHIKGAGDIDSFGYPQLLLVDSGAQYPGIVFRGTQGNHGAIRIEDGDGFSFFTVDHSTTSWARRLRIEESGQTVISTTDSSLQVSPLNDIISYGGGGWTSYYRHDTTASSWWMNTTIRDWRFYTNQSTRSEGVKLSNGSTSWSSISSDERLKDNWKMFDDALGKINSFTKIGTYNRIDPETKEVLYDGLEIVGLSAQEVQKVLPTAVTKHEDEEYWGLNYQDVFVLMVKAVQELSAEVEKLKGNA